MKKPEIKILDKYIIKKFIGTYFFALIIIIGIVIIFDISEKIDDFVLKEAPLSEIIFKYYFNFIPFILNTFSPLFVFITVIFFTSKLASNSEIIAILSGGISFKRLMFPYMISATLIAILSMVLGLYIIPPANKQRLDFEQQYIKSTKYYNATEIYTTNLQRMNLYILNHSVHGTILHIVLLLKLLKIIRLCPN